MKKDELLTLCRRQNELLAAFTQALADKETELAGLKETVRVQAAGLSSLQAGNAGLQARLAELEGLLAESNERSAKTIERLNAVFRTSFAMLETNCGELLTQCSGTVRELEREVAQTSGILTALLARSSARESAFMAECARLEKELKNIGEKLNGLRGAPLPDEWENMVERFLSGLIADLEKALSG